MGLSGETIKKIREALKSAFPNRDELVMMLRMELEIPESEVPDNSNYSPRSVRIIIACPLDTGVIPIAF